MDSEHAVLQRMGVEVEPVSGGCCGLAGSWGFERGHHDVSMQCGEQGLLPAVRGARPNQLIVTNGFSCRTQVEPSDSERQPVHLAQMMALAREGGGLDERELAERRPRPGMARRVTRTAGVGLGAAAAGGLAVVPLLRGRAGRR